MASDAIPTNTRCCIVVGGPAGMVLGYLLARAGVQTVVLEKHADFLRDFRGDAVHPSTLRIVDELGLLEEFLQRPHERLQTLTGWFQDAVATANLLAVKLRHGQVGEDDLDAVRRRRLWPTKATQAMHVVVQSNVLVPVISGANADLHVPFPMRVLTALPPLQRVFARPAGMGVRPEHVRSPTV